MNQNQIVSFIWGIADDCLRDVYVRGKYRDVILPMTVIRRLDAVLEETKDGVLAMKKMLDEVGILEQTSALCKASGEAFYNCSPFILKDLGREQRRSSSRQILLPIWTVFHLMCRRYSRSLSSEIKLIP